MGFLPNILEFVGSLIARRVKKKRAMTKVSYAASQAPSRYQLQIIDVARGLAIGVAGPATATLAREKVGSRWKSGLHLIEWAVACSEMDFHAASKSVRNWLGEHRCDAHLTIIESNKLAVLRAEIDPREAFSIDERFELARSFAERALKAGGQEAIKGESFVAGVVQYLCLRGEYERALDYLSVAMSYADTMYLSMMRAALELRSHGPTPKYIDELLGVDNNYFKGKFCAYPFLDFEVTPSGASYICCPTYLPTPIGNVNEGGVKELINSDVATKIRRSIIEGKFTYCDWTKCKHIKNDRLESLDAALASPAMRTIIEAGDGRIEAPKNVRLSYDSTCNLSCPSCRSEMIVAKGEQFDQIMHTTNTVVLPLLYEAETVMMNGYGDIFSSRSCRKLLESVSLETHPRLKLKFITNGVLLTEQEWSKFPNIHRMVDTIRVSVDAVRKETYDIVRRGGDFVKLKENLDFIARLRNKGVVREFTMSFVVQERNFREMADFAEWAIGLGCDYVMFEVIQNWNTFSDFSVQAVHLPGHPLHREFLEEAARIQSIRGSRKPTDRWTITSDFSYVIR